MSANGIGKEGASHVARALAQNTTLRALHLHGNVLKDDVRIIRIHYIYIYIHYYLHII